MNYFTSLTLIVALLGGLSTLQGCSKIKPDTGQSYPIELKDERRLKHGSLTGEDGLKIFSNKKEIPAGSTGIGVNTFLWRATLDTISFMPLSMVDPHGGVIITDWYEDPQARGARFKLNVVILGTELRSDGLRVSVFRQSLDASGNWRDDSVATNTARDLEDNILTRARELRIQSVAAQ